MKNLTIIFSTLFLVSSHLVRSSTMLDEHRESPAVPTSQTGAFAVSENNYIAKELSPQFQQRILQDQLTEQDEEAIRNMFHHDFFVTISNHGLEAEYMGNYKLAFGCMRVAAIGDLKTDQEQLAEYYFRKKNYRNAARWYLRSAFNNNPDVLAMLYRIDDETNILQHLTSEGLPQAMSILEAYWKSQEAGN